MSAKEQVPNPLGSSEKPFLVPGHVLLFRLAPIQSEERLWILRYNEHQLVDQRCSTWSRGHLTSNVLEEIEATAIDQLRLLLLTVCGVQAEMFEGLTP